MRTPSTATSAAKSSAEAGWRIDLPCPQCGAPVALEETDRLLQCEFCRVRLTISIDGTPRYHLPPRSGDAETIYVPYWRLKGQLFSCVGEEVRSGILDRTRCAISLEGMPCSLGVRPQAMRLRFVAPETPGRFLRPQMQLENLLASCDGSAGNEEQERIYCEAFIGETASLIYQPVRIEGGLLDAITGQRIGPPPDPALDAKQYLAAEELSGVRFLPPLCPECGWNLEGERDSLALICRTCGRAWSVAAGRYHRLEASVVRAEGAASYYLPFWRIRPTIQGVPLSTFADLARIANFPKIVRPEWESRELCFWTPAFKLLGSQFLRVAQILTISQPEAEALSPDTGPSLAQEAVIHPVTLPAQEAAESLIALLAQMASAKVIFFPKLPGIHLESFEAHLVLIPFLESRNEIHHPGLAICLNRNLLTYGRNL